MNMLLGNFSQDSCNENVEHFMYLPTFLGISILVF